MTIYDVSTHTLMANKEKTADRSSRMDLVKNADGSVDLYVGPTAPPGFEKNWIPTIPVGHDLLNSVSAPPPRHTSTTRGHCRTTMRQDNDGS